VRRPFSSRLLAAACGALLAFPSAAAAQIRYATGQNVVPVFEGWERNADGSFNFVFGYMNRNYEEEVDVPVGPLNAIEPASSAGPDQGQPAHFYPRRQQYVFKVQVPRDWGRRDLVWSLPSHGKTEKVRLADAHLGDRRRHLPAKPRRTRRARRRGRRPVDQD
jgi:hypothetical protein